MIQKILILLLLGMVSVFGKPCMTDIYFGNGVWNPDQDKIRNEQLKGLKGLMEGNNPTIFNKQNEKNLYQWKVAYNPSYGHIDDVIETFWQLKESGQISEGFFGAVYAALTWEESTEFYNKLTEIIQKYNQDVTTMYTIYKNASFNQKHNVLLVAHSQGNLWGNKMYTLLTDEQKKKFRMVSVGTPANHVMKPNQTSPYVTLYGDLVIRSVPNSLPANTNGGGHSFVSAYLGKIDSQIKIATYVKSAYDDLMQTTSCTLYDVVYMKVYAGTKMDIYAYTVYDTPKETALLKSIPLTTYKPTGKAPDLNCGDPTVWFGGKYFSSCGNSSSICSWRPGEVIAGENFESKKGFKQYVLSDPYGDPQCFVLEITDEIYSLVTSSLKP